MPQLRPGDAAPAFELPDQNGELVRLADFGGGPVLVYFYPMAGTPVCTKQACNIRDGRAELDTRGVRAIGISPDPPEELARFDRSRELGFPLLSDADFEAAEAYGVIRRVPLLGLRWMRRSSFLIDAEGRIAGAWYGVSASDTLPNALERLGETGA
jgi:peroxiredoxin Q/BCP